MPYAKVKVTYQSARPRSLISAFVVHWLDSIIPLVCISEISIIYLVSVTAQTGLSLSWSETAKTGFLVTRLIVTANPTSLYLPYKIISDSRCPKTHKKASTATSRENTVQLSTNGQPRDKTNKVACAPSEDSDQPGHPSSQIKVFALRLMSS